MEASKLQAVAVQIRARLQASGNRFPTALQVYSQAVEIGGEATERYLAMPRWTPETTPEEAAASDQAYKDATSVHQFCKILQIASMMNSEA